MPTGSLGLAVLTVDTSSTPLHARTNLFMIPLFAARLFHANPRCPSSFSLFNSRSKVVTWVLFSVAFKTQDLHVVQKFMAIPYVRQVVDV